jgi:hypothetical protein
MIGVNNKKGGIQDLSGKLRLAHDAGCSIEPADIDPFAVALSHSVSGALAYVLKARIGTEVHKEVAALSHGGLASQSGDRKDKKQAERAAIPSHVLDLLAAG